MAVVPRVVVYQCCPVGHTCVCVCVCVCGGGGGGGGGGDDGTHVGQNCKVMGTPWDKACITLCLMTSCDQR